MPVPTSELAKEGSGERQLFPGAVYSKHALFELRRSGSSIAVPAQMFSGDPDAGFFAIKTVQRIQVAKHDITDFADVRLD